ncbi:MAG: cytochrome b/b6 domain-containing protein [Gammaproteobacteria bacterium]
MLSSAEKAKLVLVWPASIRLLHWVLALGTLILWASGWVMGHSTDLFAAARDIHLLSAHTVTVALLGRIGLLLTDRGVGGIRVLATVFRRPALLMDMFRFYASFGATPLPRWYAHNPFWGPLYLLLFVLIGIQVAGGYGMLWRDWAVDSLHRGVATAIAMWMLLHLLTVILVEIKGTGSNISALLHGKRVFPDEVAPTDPFETPQGGQKVDFVSLGKRPVDGDQKR